MSKDSKPVVWEQWDHSRFKPVQVVVNGNPDQAVKKFIRKTREQVERRPGYFLSKGEKRRKKRAYAAFRRTLEEG